MADLCTTAECQLRASSEFCQDKEHAGPVKPFYSLNFYDGLTTHQPSARQELIQPPIEVFVWF